MYSKVFSILKVKGYDPLGNKWEQYKWMQKLRGGYFTEHSKTSHALGYRTIESFACKSCTKKARQGRNKIMTPIIRKIGTIIKKLVEESNGFISVDYSKKRYKDTKPKNNWAIQQERVLHNVHKYTWTIKNETHKLMQILLVIYDDYFKGDDIIRKQSFYSIGQLPSGTPQSELPLQLEGENNIILNPNFEQILHSEIYVQTSRQYKPSLVVASEERSFGLLKNVVDENPNADLGQAVILEGVFDGGDTYKIIDKEKKINNSLIIKLDWHHDFRDYLSSGTINLLDGITPDTLSDAEMFLFFNLEGNKDWCIERAIVIPESAFYNAQNPYIKWMMNEIDDYARPSTAGRREAKPVTPVKNTSELLSGKIAMLVGELCLSRNSKKQFQRLPKNDFLATMVLMSRNQKDWESMWE